MDFFNIIILGMVSFIVLFILSKIMGYRAISELSFFDYVVGITIGSIAAEMSTNIDMEWWKGVTAMAVYAILDLVFSFLSQKSSAARQIITGNPIILIYKGKIYKKNLRKARIELNDLLTSARMAGYFNIADIDYAIMETTGKISFMPVPLKRPLNPKDFNFAPQSEGLTVNVIMDGKIMEDDLADAKIDKNDLIRRVKQQDKEVKNVFLGVMDSNGVLTLFDK
ncbi:MAG: DUF421 domain-containing protein [Eubacterium sp.]|nr:DUF421 domain-containing protein [Eubacterium sp.]